MKTEKKFLYYLNGMKMIQKKDFKSAIDYFLQSINIKERGYNSITLGALGYCYFKLNMIKEALQYFETDSFLSLSTRDQNFSVFTIGWIEAIYSSKDYSKFLELKNNLMNGINNVRKIKLVDNLNNPFNNNHELIQLLDCFIYWKIERNFQKALDQFNSSAFKRKQLYIDEINKEVQSLNFYLLSQSNYTRKETQLSDVFSSQKGPLSQSEIKFSIISFSDKLKVPKKYVEYIYEMISLLNKIDPDKEYFIKYSLVKDTYLTCESNSFLFDYIHNDSYKEEDDPVYDEMTYEEKYQIIRQIAKALLVYYEGVDEEKRNIHRYLTPFNIFICGEETTMVRQNRKEIIVKYPKIKIGFLPSEMLVSEGKQIENWTYYGDYDLDEEDRTKEPHFLYSFAVIIWEILSRKIPFPKVNSLDPPLIKSHLKTEKLSALPFKNDIPYSLYEFMYRFINRTTKLNYQNEEQITELLNIILEDTPESKFIEENRQKKCPIIYEPLSFSREVRDKGVELSRFGNFGQFDYDNDFIEGMEDAQKCEISHPNLALIIGCSVHGFSPNNKYFYTEYLDESLATFFKSGKQLEEKQIITYLNQLYDIIKFLNGSHGYITNCLDENYIHFTKNHLLLKILNYGKNNTAFLQTMFKHTNLTDDNSNTPQLNLEDKLIEDFVYLATKFFAYELKGRGNTNEEIFYSLKKEFIQSKDEHRKNVLKFLAVMIGYLQNTHPLNPEKLLKYLSSMDK